MRAFFALSVSFMVASQAHAAFVIRDASFFNAIPHKFLDFETRGDGSPVNLPFLGIEVINPTEYQAQGIVFDERTVAWFQVGTPNADLGGEGNAADAIQAIGSLSTALGGSAASGWAIHFSEPVHAFGFGVVRSGFHRDDPTLLPRIEAYDAIGSLIGTLELSGDLVQGNFGGLWADGAFGEHYKVEYGFMGLASSTPIARLEFSNAGGYDNFYFSAVPAPGAGAVFVMAGALAMRRRR